MKQKQLVTNSSLVEAWGGVVVMFLFLLLGTEEGGYK